MSLKWNRVTCRENWGHSMLRAGNTRSYSRAELLKSRNLTSFDTFRGRFR